MIHLLVSQGPDSHDAGRVNRLFDRAGVKSSMVVWHRGGGFLSSMASVWSKIRDRSIGVIFLEGTGMRCGLPVLFLSVLRRGAFQYVVSSGDPVGRFVKNRYGFLFGALANAYESLLYRRSSGFVGWSPYLVGRAVRMGAPSGVTVEGQPDPVFNADAGIDRASVRRELGVEDGQILIGVSGSLNWSRRQKYAYGREIIEAASRVTRTDVRYIVVGGGEGRQRLARLAQTRGVDIAFVDQVSRPELASLMAAMDLAVIGQTPDEVGLLRLTTKLPEYLSVGTPVAMPGMPGAIDYLVGDWKTPLLILPRTHPASVAFAEALASLIEGLSLDDLHARRVGAIAAAGRFDIEVAAKRLEVYLETIL